MATKNMNRRDGSSPSRLSKAMQKIQSSTTGAHSPRQIYLDSLAPSGRKAMETLLNQCISIIAPHHPAEQFDWGQLDFASLHAVRATLLDCGYAVNTVNLALVAMRGVAKAAFNLGQMDADNILRLNAVKPVKGSATKVGRRLGMDEIRLLLSACESLPCAAHRARETAILKTAIGTGLRCFELCALNYCEVNLHEKIVSVEQGKGRKRRHIYIADEIRNAITTWLQHRGVHEGPLFNRIFKDGKISRKALSSSGLVHALREVQKLSGAHPFTVHDLRRTFISQLLENGIDLNTVRQLAGHSDINTTVRYDKRGEEWQRRASQGFSF